MTDPVYEIEPIAGSTLRLGWRSRGKNGRTLMPVLVEDETKGPYDNPGYANRRVGQSLTVTIRFPDVRWRSHLLLNVPEGTDAYEGAARFMCAIAREYWPA